MSAPDGLTAAIDLLVREYGVEGALAELQDRHQQVSVGDDAHDRVVATLGELKRRRATE